MSCFSYGLGYPLWTFETGPWNVTRPLLFAAAAPNPPRPPRGPQPGRSLGQIQGKTMGKSREPNPRNEGFPWKTHGKNDGKIMGKSSVNETKHEKWWISLGKPMGKSYLHGLWMEKYRPVENRPTAQHCWKTHGISGWKKDFPMVEVTTNRELIRLWIDDEFGILGI